MTVILEKDNRVYVYCKGADNIILERLRHKDTKTVKTTQERIEHWSVEGLRTLLFARREIRKEDYEKWAKMYAYSLSRLEKVEKDENIKLKKQFIQRLSIDPNPKPKSSQNISLEIVGKMIIED